MPSLGFVGSPAAAPPGGGAPYDDEFDDSSTLTSRWTQTGVGGLIYRDIDTTVPDHAYLQAFLLQPAPTTFPYTITAECTAITWTGGATPGVGNSSVAIAQAAPGPYYFVGVDVGFAGTQELTSSLFDSSGNFVGNSPSLPTGSGVSGGAYSIPHRIEVTVNSASNIDARISFNSGGSWTTILSGFNPGIAPNYIGLANGGSQGTWDWFRVT